MKKRILLIKRSQVRKITYFDEVMSQERKNRMHKNTYILTSEDYPHGLEDNRIFENKMEVLMYL